MKIKGLFNLSDIRFWLVLFFFIRLYAIQDPPLEVAHNWRQTTVTMAARNFLEVDNNILFPRVDFAGEKSGITGMEFPLLNYLIYLMSLVFGYAHWYGRLINLVVSSVGLFYFYRLIKKYRDESFSFNATFILLFSVWFTYSRKIMPDTFSVSLVIAGLYYGSDYLEKKPSFKSISLCFILTLLGLLSKLPAIYLMILYIPLFYRSDKKQKILFACMSTLMLLPVALYYFYWVPYLTNQYGFSHFFMGKNMLIGLNELILDWSNTLEKFYLDALQIIGFALFLLGLFYLVKKKERFILWVFGLGSLSFLVIMFKAGFTFSHHSYYIVPFAPIMAIVAAYALSQMKSRKMVLLFLTLIAFESLANKFHDFTIKENNMAMLQLEGALTAVGNRNEKILLNSGDVPTPMYFSHRKGWIAFNEQIKNKSLINDLKGMGLRHIVILKKSFGSDLVLDYPVLFNSADFTIYQP